MFMANARAYIFTECMCHVAAMLNISQISHISEMTNTNIFNMFIISVINMFKDICSDNYMITHG